MMRALGAGLLSYLVCASLGLRLQSLLNRARYVDETSDVAGRLGGCTPSRAIAKLLLALKPAAGWRVGIRCDIRQSSVSSAARHSCCHMGGTQLVWFTGAGDMRVHDHGGLTAAASAGDSQVVPIFIIDPDVHLRYPPSRLGLLHTALKSIEHELGERYALPLIVRRGNPSELLPVIAENCSAITCHMIVDDVEEPMRHSQRAASAALEAAGVDVQRWDSTLRLIAEQLPTDFPAYVDAVSSLSIQAPVEAPDKIPSFSDHLASEPIMSLEDLLSEAAALASPGVLAARERQSASTVQPYDEVARSMGQERLAREALQSYGKLGRDAFADARFGDAAGSAKSLHAAAAQRLLSGGAKPSQVLALREAPTRAFAPALAVGSLSARDVRKAATDAGATPAAVGEKPWWGRSSEGALADTVEWREWFLLLARRSLALQDAGESPTTGAQRPQSGDARAAGRVAYWRWGGQYLVRYASWEAGPAYAGKTPAMLFVHGFAASAEQWERLVYELRAQASAETGMSADELPPIYALDLLGFGHAEKPGLSYTQYLWEAQIVDFVHEVMGGVELVLCGNSIGGGLSAGASATLGPLCKGVVLCNTAGVLIDGGEYEEPAQGNSMTDKTLEGRAGSYSPVPLFGPSALELFGNAIIGLIYPQIEKRLADIYSDRPSNADPAATYAIQQGASSPGSANVIGSGQKLAPNRPLNEVLGRAHGFGGPVLVAQGLNDRVSSPERAKSRADTFDTMRDGVTVERIVGGHCPHDDSPDAVARAMLRWLPEVREWASRNN